MKKQRLVLVTMLILVASGLSAQTDTLYPVYSFDTPSEHPWGLACDGANLWMSDVHSGAIFKLTMDGDMLGSIALENKAITGITFVNDTLWAMNALTTGDTVINEETYPLFTLYQLNQASGELLDSLHIVSLVGNLPYHSYWGVCQREDYFYISFDGGYGPCLHRIHRFTEQDTTLCCTHLKGMTVINDSIWGVSYFDKEIVTTDGLDMFTEFQIPFYATDLTWDGSNFWMMDTMAHKIRKMEDVSITGFPEKAAYEPFSVFPNPARSSIVITTDRLPSRGRLLVCDMIGRLVNSRELQNDAGREVIDITKLTPGVYFITLKTDSYSFTRRFVKR